MKCSLPLGISALACAIAEEIEDNDELTLLAAVLVLLSDALNTIVAQRIACDKTADTVPPSIII